MGWGLDKFRQEGWQQKWGRGIHQKGVRTHQKWEWWVSSANYGLYQCFCCHLWHHISRWPTTQCSTVCFYVNYQHWGTLALEWVTALSMTVTWYVSAAGRGWAPQLKKEPFSDFFPKMVQLRATRCFSCMISSLLGEVIHAKPHFAKPPN